VRFDRVGRRGVSAVVLDSETVKVITHSKILVLAAVSQQSWDREPAQLSRHDQLSAVGGESDTQLREFTYYNQPF
jgi:hypothetical protein